MGYRMVGWVVGGILDVGRRVGWWVGGMWDDGWDVGLIG